MAHALIVVTNHGTLGATGRPTGWYLPEVSHVYWPLIEAGFTVSFASPSGGRAPMDPGSRKLDDPLNARFVAEVAGALDDTLAPDDVDPAEVDVVYFAGGHGTMWDFAGSPALDRLTAAVWARGGVVSSVCHGAAALVNVTLPDGAKLVAGRRVASFTDAEERAVGLDGVVPYL
ncbi:MAG: type 1 glutamine amidotransferase domain-containing protein, partial [Myxococcota bacterium]